MREFLAELKWIDQATEEGKNRIAATERQFMEACKEIDDRILWYLSYRLCNKAVALDIEAPPTDDKEMWGLVKTAWGEVKPALTPKGRHHLRKLIDAEKARRFEVRTLWVTKFWLPLLAALVGIIGALTGLMAVLQHKK